jgi:hypothetical protein
MFYRREEPEKYKCCAAWSREIMSSLRLISRTSALSTKRPDSTKAYRVVGGRKRGAVGR